MPKTPGYYMDDIEPEFHAETGVEKSLNSRCSCDLKDDQTAHWGIFDPAGDLIPEHIGAIEQSAQIPRFTNYELKVDIDINPIRLSLCCDRSDIVNEWVHIESGMQQQAIHLVCSALGIGACIKNLGPDGTARGTRIETVAIDIQRMKPSYNNSFWTVLPPDDLIISPQLPEPRRDSDFPLLKAMEDAETSSIGRSVASSDISQLLWAARGITPHTVMGHQRGFTIPTWGGSQNIASIYLSQGGMIYKYINFSNNTPVHELSPVCESAVGNSGYADILLSVNESAKRALWEVGYMLENLILQAIALGIEYKAILTDFENRKVRNEAGCMNVCAILRIKL